MMQLALQTMTFASPPPMLSNKKGLSTQARKQHCSNRNISAVMEPQPRINRTYNPEDHIRPSLRNLDPYTPIVPYEVLAQRLGRDPSQIVKLDANENPYGPSPNVVDALAEAAFLHIYPDPESTMLRDALQDYTSVPRDYIMAGAGADELIDLLFRLFITPGSGQSIVNCPPTFGMYKFDADVNGAETINVPRSKDTFEVDVDAVEKLFEGESSSHPRMVFVASPNNPDGSTLSDAALRRLLALPTLVVLDEAYFEFADDNRITWVPEYDNLIVLRTFSKWAALAGMRIGYGAFPLRVIKHLWKIKQPYNVSVASQIAAKASIEGKADLLGKVNRLLVQRAEFYEKVANYSWLSPFPSQSNYVLCRVGEGRTAKDIVNGLIDRGVLVRYYSSPGLSDCIRVSMGTEDQMARLYEALEEL